MKSGDKQTNTRLHCPACGGAEFFLDREMAGRAATATCASCGRILDRDERSGSNAKSSTSRLDALTEALATEYKIVFDDGVKKIKGD
ncbi:hypothetical protein [Pseudodesulfovibrio sp.]|uniref:hypothetical protein n=1 Tax=unclassified Pseudodesulfovibrio TaxID=2661612 RepID=UPI003B004AEE